MTVVEFCQISPSTGNPCKELLHIHSDVVPSLGDLVTIQQIQGVVQGVRWAIDLEESKKAGQAVLYASVAVVDPATAPILRPT